MSDHEPLTEERVAQVNEQLDEVHRFLLALIDDPSPLQKIPTGSTLRHRTIQMNDHRIQLTAHRLSESDDPWTARVTDWDSPSELGVDEFAYTMESDFDSTPNVSPHPEDDQLVVEMAETADAALDALERLILKQRAQVPRA